MVIMYILHSHTVHFNSLCFLNHRLSIFNQTILTRYGVLLFSFPSSITYIIYLSINRYLHTMQLIHILHSITTTYTEYLRLHTNKKTSTICLPQSTFTSLYFQSTFWLLFLSSTMNVDAGLPLLKGGPIHSHPALAESSVTKFGKISPL